MAEGLSTRVKRCLDAAVKALPEAERYAGVRSQLEGLRDKRIGVNMHAGAALAELHAIESALGSLAAS